MHLNHKNTLSTRNRTIKKLLTSIRNRTSEALNTLKTSKKPQYINHYRQFFTCTAPSTANLLHELWIAVSGVLFALMQHLNKQANTRFFQHVATSPEFQDSWDCWMSGRMTESCKYVWRQHLPFTQNIRFDWIMRKLYLATLVLVWGAFQSRKAVMSSEPHCISVTCILSCTYLLSFLSFIFIYLFI